MRYLLASLCSNFFIRNRQACLCCALVVLNILFLLFIGPFLMAQEPTVYGIVDLRGVKEDQNFTAELERRKKLFLYPKILRDALNDLAAAGKKPPRLNEEKWLSEVLLVETLDKPVLVRVGLADGTPAEQAVVINAVLRAYIRYFEEVERNRPNETLRHLEARNEGFARMVQIREVELANLNDPQAGNASPNVEWRKENLKADIATFKETILKTADQIDEIQAAASRLPVVVEWAQAP